MSTDLSPPKVVLLAAHFTATGDITSLASLTARHGEILRKNLVLRLLLTYLPSHLPTEEYLPLLQSLESANYSTFFPLQDIDALSVQLLSEEQAAKKARKLRLQPLSSPDTEESTKTRSSEPAIQQIVDPDAEKPEDPLAMFLIQRASAVDDGSGALHELPALLTPFLGRSYDLRTWTISVLLPLLRRNCEYYPEAPLQLTLADFEHLPDRLAVSRLLSNTGVHSDSLAHVGRDLRGLIGPWLYNDRRWTKRRSEASEDYSPLNERKEDRSQNGNGAYSQPQNLCPGWDEVLLWLTTQATNSWRVAVKAIEQWDGPSDADLGDFGSLWLDDDEQGYLERRYAQAALACVYLLPEASEEAMMAAHSIVCKIAGLLDQDPIPALSAQLSLSSPISATSNVANLLSSENATYLRNDLLDETNVLTTPTRPSIELLHALVLSGTLFNRMGSPCTIRRVSELAMLQNEREQKAEAVKLIHWVATNGSTSDDHYWTKAREEILWLRDWGAADHVRVTSDELSAGRGVLGQVKRNFVEVEFLKALLANTRVNLARTLYENSPDQPLSEELMQETVIAAAMAAYDGASNPNRTRGGLKKCDEIIHAFPRTIEKSWPATRRVEALLSATHGLCDYRLVLKQGEPFTPVVLRVHTDPLSIIGKILEQNPKSFTNIQNLLSIATDIVDAGLTMRDKAGQSILRPEQVPLQRDLARRRVTAMCINAALNEDDFETAYSYVTSRLPIDPATPTGAVSAAEVGTTSVNLGMAVDIWSWRAALEAGKYRRTNRTVRPTHLGTSSANLDIRHLEQRIECLATALRIAPSDTLQEILNAYRRCEEELEATVLAENEQESAWDDAADESWQQAAVGQKRLRPQSRYHSGNGSMPGGFAGLDSDSKPSQSNTRLASRLAAAAATTATYGDQAYSQTQRQQRKQSASALIADDAPLSLFELSRATARAASRNFSALSSLRQTRQLVEQSGGGDMGDDTSARGGREIVHEGGSGTYVRKRDQLRDAALGTLTSGVGWLIGSQPVDRAYSGRE
ncbi:hypothetical protein SEPCBS57363_006393 [Sporothrix epigloea]|uniref:Sec39 domain-containing protein n=1 Tax=Sporothrix epigloea TaxID=1892477 RepID=A0ABP0E714_9PEZI